MVKTYINIEEVVVAVIEMERVLGELEETPYKPMKEEQDERVFGESTMDHQLHVLNETLVNFFGKEIDGKVGLSTTFSTTNNHCQLCRSEEHMASTCPKLIDTRPKCAKCGGGHKIDNCGLKCSFCFGLKHMENWCWKKFAKGLFATTSFLKVLVDDEKKTLSKLKHICGEDQHVFLKVKIPKASNPILEQEEGIVEEEHKEVNMGVEFVIKSKIPSHFIKGKISLTLMKTILIISREFEYLEGLIKLTKRRKDVEGQKNQIAVVHVIPAIKRMSINKAHCSKTLHLAVKINQAYIEGLVDIRVSMLVMASSIVRKVGVMHLMAGHETYRTTFGIVT